MSYPEFYARISAPLRAHTAAARALGLLDKGLVAIVAAAYIGAAVWLAVAHDGRLVRFIAVPAIGFALLTAVRAALDRPRPYEAYDIDPLIAKGTTGKSFPSRHIFSAAMIACALLWIDPVAGAIGFACTAAVSLCRIAGGVHFPRDVVWAVVFALACGAAGFALAP